MQIKIELLEGRQHYVVPTVMIVEGVLHGSGGPILWPAKLLKESAEFWNGKPVVVYHPDMYVSNSAANPIIFDRQKIGTLFSSRCDGKRLLADAWIDADRVAVVDQRVLNAIQTRRMMEVSTGGHVYLDETRQTHNGVDLVGVAEAVIPDHLAILPDQLGACSIEDGAGLIRNREALIQMTA